MLCAEENSISYKKIIAFTVCLVLTVLCKVPYAPLSLLIFAVPNIKFKKYKYFNIIIIKIISIIFVGLASVMTILYSTSKNLIQWNVAGADSKRQVLFIINNLPRYFCIMGKYTLDNALLNFEKAVSLLSYNGDVDSVWVQIIIISIFIMAFTDWKSKIFKLTNEQKIIILVSVVLSWILVITALYVTFTPVGNDTIWGVQGRYIIPLLLPFLLLLKNNKLCNSINKEKLNYIISIGYAFIIIVTLIEIFSKFSV